MGVSLFDMQPLSTFQVFYLEENLQILLLILQASNLLYVDQPTGTGFSYTSDKRDIRHNEDGVSNDLYDFLQVCLSIHNKSYCDRKIIQ